MSKKYTVKTTTEFIHDLLFKDMKFIYGYNRSNWKRESRREVILSNGINIEEYIHGRGTSMRITGKDNTNGKHYSIYNKMECVRYIRDELNNPNSELVNYIEERLLLNV